MSMCWEKVPILIRVIGSPSCDPSKLLFGLCLTSLIMQVGSAVILIVVMNVKLCIVAELSVRKHQVHA